MQLDRLVQRGGNLDERTARSVFLIGGARAGRFLAITNWLFRWGGVGFIALVVVMALAGAPGRGAARCRGWVGLALVPAPGATDTHPLRQKQR